jgi:catechol 2,3-dioxygenase-like lactoylglutathione lyase family enzyme
MGFPIVSDHDWFIEFRIVDGLYLSCMDETHTSIKSSRGSGTTITIKVDDAETVHADLKQRGAEPADLKVRHWAVKSFFLHDPDGYRLEIWSEYYKRPQTKRESKPQPS